AGGRAGLGGLPAVGGVPWRRPHDLRGRGAGGRCAGGRAADLLPGRLRPFPALSGSVAGRTAAVAGAALLGLALGVAAPTGRRLRRHAAGGRPAAAGLPVSGGLAGVAAGLGAGWRGGRGGAGGRWVLAVLSFAVAAVFATVWSASPGLRAA